MKLCVHKEVDRLENGVSRFQRMVDILQAVGMPFSICLLYTSDAADE